MDDYAQNQGTADAMLVTLLLQVTIDSCDQTAHWLQP